MDDITEDITPEHTKRGSIDHATEGELHPELIAAYDYVDSVLHTADTFQKHLWYGWSIREAFMAGISYAERKK